MSSGKADKYTCQCHFVSDGHITAWLLLCLLKSWLKEMFVGVSWWTVLTWRHSSALCYCTVFSVLLWMWQSVCSSYCRQLNAVSFNTDTSCCTVQIHIQSAVFVLFRYTADSKIPERDYYLRHVRLSVLPSAWNNSSSTRWISLKFDICVFFKIFSKN